MPTLQVTNSTTTSHASITTTSEIPETQKLSSEPVTDKDLLIVEFEVVRELVLTTA